MKKTKKLDFTFSTFDKVTEKTVYQIGMIGCLAGHIIYLIMFKMLGVTPIVRYNYFSVTFYVTMYLLVTKFKRRNPIILISMLEFVVHSCMCIYYMGWNLGFAMFMLFIVPIPFFMPMKRLSVPYAISMVDIVIFVVMKLYMSNREGIYLFDNIRINNTIYLLNMFFGFLIITYVSSIYMVNRETTHYKLKAKNESLQKLASVDPLTQLFNRRAMMDFLRMIQCASTQNQNSYIIGLGDIDDFKRVNDTYGHDTGDEVLRAVSKIMTDCVPAEGYVCRWGGEEFLFAIPSIGLEEGKNIAEEIIRRIHNYDFCENGKQFRISMTLGICEAGAGENFEKYITLADNRLYKGKKNGKNQVISSD